MADSLFCRPSSRRDTHAAPARLDEKLLEECTTAWVASFQFNAKNVRGRARASFAGPSVDRLLAEAGIVLPAGRHSLSEYRCYEEEIVRLAYARMGMERPVAA